MDDYAELRRAPAVTNYHHLQHRLHEDMPATYNNQHLPKLT